jgi:hypothetical protein
MAECQECGYVLQPFERTCPRCARAAARALASVRSPRLRPAQRDRRLPWAIAGLVLAVAAFVVVWLHQPRAPSPFGGTGESNGYQSSSAGGALQNPSASPTPDVQQGQTQYPGATAAAPVEGTSSQTGGGESTAGASYDGTWSGTTSEGQQISFTVEGGAIAHTRVVTMLRTTKLLGGERAIQITAENRWEAGSDSRPRITGTTFQATGECPVFTSGQGSITASYVISGSFTSPGMASGSAQFQLNGDVSLLTDTRAWSASWTAGRP